MYEQFTKAKNDGGHGLTPKAAVVRIADELEISTVSVNINPPYGKVVYDLKENSSNARRIEGHRAKKKG